MCACVCSLSLPPSLPPSGVATSTLLVAPSVTAVELPVAMAVGAVGAVGGPLVAGAGADPGEEGEEGDTGDTEAMVEGGGAMVEGGGAMVEVGGADTAEEEEGGLTATMATAHRGIVPTSLVVN